jgi:hypothetical protein
MIPLDSLRILQVNFIKYRNDNERTFIAAERLRNEFTQIFTEERIDRMSMDQYVIGEVGGKESFCYWMENKLKATGNIKGGSPADKKFGLYYGKTKNDPTKIYRFINKYGTTAEEAFTKIKSEITHLLNAGKQHNIDSIKDCILPPVFKGKILSTYFPEQYLNVFSREHLKYFCDYLDIPYLKEDDEVILRERLAIWKNKDVQISQFSLTDFGRFLYLEIKRPSKPEELTPEILKATVKILPNISTIRPIELAYKTQHVLPIQKPIYNDDDPQEHRRVPKKNYIIEHMDAMNLGKRGEEAVIILEKRRLQDNQRKDLSEKVVQISLTNDSAGYDILSFAPDGKEIYIEVKATSWRVSDPSVSLSIHELAFAKSHPNYILAIVFEADTQEPKIWYIKNPFDLPADHYSLIPSRYSLQLAISYLVDKT